MNTITTRNILRMWHSTNPALVGYADSMQHAEDALARLLASTPFRGTVRQVAEEIKSIRKEVGNTFCHFEIRTANGRVVSRDDLFDCISEAEYRRAYSR